MSDDLSIPNPGYRSNRAGRYGTYSNRVRQGIDPDTRRLVLFATGLGAVLLSLIVASMLIGHHSTEVPVIAADPRPIRIKPENPGGMKIDGAENDVFSGGTDTANSRLAPPPETPDAKALQTTAAAPLPPAIPAPEPLAPPPPVPVARAAAPTSSLSSASPIAAAKPASSKPPAVVESHPSSPAHPTMVQLAALGSEEAAHKEWEQLAKRMPDLLNGKQPVISRTERDGHTYWRLRTAGFADIAQARSFCGHVRTKGGGCSIADF